MPGFNDFEYSTTENGISITKYSGSSSFVIVPENINGILVTNIGDNAFRDHKEIKEVIIPDSIVSIGNYAFCECRGLKAIELPDKISFAGDHMLYNCRGIEKISIPSDIEYIGDGFIKNCDQLKYITITDEKISSGVSYFLNELSTEVTLFIKNRNLTLILPGFGYEYIDKCYSRTFETITHGTGVMYRRCIEKNKININTYDSVFKYASRQEMPYTLCLIAINRLMASDSIDEESRNLYISYLKENIYLAVELAIKEEKSELMEIFENNDIFTAENISKAIETSRKKQRADFTSELMDIKMRKFGRTKKVFDI